MGGNVERHIGDDDRDGSVSVSCPAPTPDDETYYSKGKDANWLAALSDEDLAEAVCFAAQDLNDTGLGDDLDKWMPFQAMMSIAADRIKKLITAQPSVSDAPPATQVTATDLERIAADFEKDSNLDRYICCNGRDCGCQGATAGAYAAYKIRALAGDGEISRLKESRAKADAVAGNGRIACVRVEFEEGQYDD